MHTDAPLLADALAQVDALNARLPTAAGAPPRFLLIHRPRRWCHTQRRWLGWERKRGKLELLVRALATGGWEGFETLAPTLRLQQGIRFVLTLDSDTGLPPGALRELVAVADHPLNAPRVDPASRRVKPNSRRGRLPTQTAGAAKQKSRCLTSATCCSSSIMRKFL